MQNNPFWQKGKFSIDKRCLLSGIPCYVIIFILIDIWVTSGKSMALPIIIMSLIAVCTIVMSVDVHHGNGAESKDGQTTKK